MIFKVNRVSSRTQEGIPQLWEVIKKFQETMFTSGQLEINREKQYKVWMWNQIRDNVILLFKSHPAVKPKISKLEYLVSKGVMTAGHAADILLTEFKKSYEVTPESKEETLYRDSSKRRKHITMDKVEVDHGHDDS